MTENELRDLCSRTNQPPTNHPHAWPVFVEQMRGLIYSYDACTAAWFWFLRGWYARGEHRA